MEAANDLLENEQRRKRTPEAEERETRPRGLSFSRKGVNFEIDRSSSVSARASLGLEDGKPKVKKFGIEYRKEF
jgi:hypothetical protein